jgi:dTDP-4-dehydrorhamnose 3,5-epimerase
VVESDIKGVFSHRLQRHEDERGWLCEIFRSDEIADDELTPVMSYISITRPGVTRGPHEHKEQTDYFVFPGISKFEITLWDNRELSATNGKKTILEAAENSALCLIVPPGIVHAYTNTGSIDGVIINCPNRLFRGWGKSGPVDEIRHEEDPDSLFRI